MSKDPNFLIRANSTLMLSNDVKSLELPKKLHWVIWDTDLIDSTLKKYLIYNDSDYKKAFIKKLPGCLRYASSVKIERDIDRFFNMSPKLV